MSIKPTSLEELFDETEQEPTTPAEATPDGTPATAAPAHADQGEPTSEDAPPASDPSQVPAEAMVPRKALEEERKKRQKWEKEAAEAAAFRERVPQYEAQLRDMQAREQQWQEWARQVQAAQQQPDQPDPLSDPQAYMAVMQQQVSTLLEQRNAEIAHHMWVTKVEASQDAMRAVHKDYDEVETVFAEAMKADPTLQHKLRMAPSPARFAYEEGKRIKLLQEIGNDPEKYIEAKLAERLKAAQAAASSPTTPTQTAPPPRSLAGVPSSAPRNAGAVWNGPTPLEDILK